MKRILSKLSLVIGSLLILATAYSCQKDLNSEEKRHLENNEAFAKYEENSEYRRVSVDGISGHVMMKWLKKGEGELYPIATSRVDVHYTLRTLIHDQVIEDNYHLETPTRITIYRSENDRTLYGMAIALQNMVVGDECEVIIPWYMAYGVKGKLATATTAPVASYVALRCTIRLDGIIPEEARKQ